MATFLNPDAIKDKSINFDKLDIPSIPTKTSELTNDSGFLTASSSINATKLNGKDSTYFAKSSHEHRENNILQGFNSKGISYIDKKGDSIFSCNRLAFKNPDEIFVEYSNDGGSTWIEYTLSDNDKIGFTSIQNTIKLYLGNRHKNGIAVTEENPLSDQDMLRVTIDSSDRYVNIEKFLVYLSVNNIGSELGLYMQLEKSTQGAPDTFEIIYDYFQVTGWAGWNSVSSNKNGYSGVSWGSSASSNADKMRFTFKYGQGEVSGTYDVGAAIYNIFGYGATLWSKIDAKKYSNLAVDGHLYSYDQSMNARFPGDILPHITNNKNIGNSTLQWDNVFSKNIYENGKNINEIYLITNGKQLKTINGNNLIGDGDIEISSSSLGLSSAFRYCGVTTTPLSDGATINPIIINENNHTAETGCVVFYGDKEFIYNGSIWEEFGYSVDLSGYKTKQNEVNTPDASGDATSFIDSIFQDVNGEITVTKKNVDYSQYATKDHTHSFTGQSHSHTITPSGEVTLSGYVDMDGVLTITTSFKGTSNQTTSSVTATGLIE